MIYIYFCVTQSFIISNRWSRWGSVALYHMYTHVYSGIPLKPATSLYIYFVTLTFEITQRDSNSQVTARLASQFMYPFRSLSYAVSISSIPTRSSRPTDSPFQRYRSAHCGHPKYEISHQMRLGHIFKCFNIINVMILKLFSHNS